MKVCIHVNRGAWGGHKLRLLGEQLSETLRRLVCEVAADFYEVNGGRADVIVLQNLPHNVEAGNLVNEHPNLEKQPPLQSRCPASAAINEYRPSFEPLIVQTTRMLFSAANGAPPPRTPLTGLVRAFRTCSATPAAAVSSDGAATIAVHCTRQWTRQWNKIVAVNRIHLSGGS